MEIRQALANELSAWAEARRVLAVAKRRVEEHPNDPVGTAQLERAEQIAKETTDMLKAAVHAHGFSMEELQNELRGE